MLFLLAIADLPILYKVIDPQLARPAVTYVATVYVNIIYQGKNKGFMLKTRGGAMLKQRVYVSIIY